MKKILLFTIGILLACYTQAQQEKSLQRIEKNGKWGYADDKGNEVIRCQFDHAYPFYESDLALVESGGMFGYVNKQNKLVIPLQYQKAYPFSDGRAAVKKKGKFGFINMEGHTELEEFEFDDVKWGFIDGYAWVKKGKKKNGKWGMIYKNGSTYVDFNYKEVLNFDPETGAADALTKDGVIHYYLKNYRYLSKKERDEAIAIPAPTPTPTPKKPLFVWKNLPSSTTTPQLTLTVEIQSESEITSCDLHLQGESVRTKGSYRASDIIENPDKNGFSKTLSRTFRLQEGENVIVAEATNAAGPTKEEKKVVYREPEPPDIVWEGNYPEKTTKELLEVKASITSKGDVSWKMTVTSSVSTKGSSVAKDIIENVVASGIGNSVKDTVTLSPGYNTITIEATNAFETRAVSKTIRYSPCEKRIALVIGNADYDNPEKILPCTTNDAHDVAEKFRLLGFKEVIEKKNLKLDDMIRVVDTFKEKAKEYDVVVLYYSGHGRQTERVNYLIPTDYNFDTGDTKDCMALTYVLKDMKDSQMKIVIFDACRDQPIPKGDAADIDAMNNPNVYVAYASAVGQVSNIIGGSKHSVFTGAFLKTLDKPNLTLTQIMFEIRKLIPKENGKPVQIPYVENSIEEDFIFNKK